MSDKFLREKYGLKESAIADFSRDKAEEEDLKFWTNREKEFNDWKKILKKSIKIPKNFIVYCFYYRELWAWKNIIIIEG